MPCITELLQQGSRCPEHQPWPRSLVDPGVWTGAATLLEQGQVSLLGLWGEANGVHMALMESQSGEIGVISLACPDGRFPSVGLKHAPALRPERAIRSLFGLEPVGTPDARPWLDHGRWGSRAPLGASPASVTLDSPYAFLPAEGEGLHQVAVGPVHAGIIEPGHFRFTANGETIVRLEERLGYTHKGIEGLMTGADLQRATKLAGRISGDSTVAYAIAFSRSVEAALGIEAPPRAHWLRALMAELERLANHLGDIGAICNDASFALMQTHCAILRERVLRTAGICFGHRLMRDRVLPGGVTADLDHANISALEALLGNIRKRFPALVELYDYTASLLDRTVATGYLKPQLARQYAAGGYVGRGSGRDFDARRAPGYPPYDGLEFKVPVREDGDVNARIWIRIDEVEASLSLIEQILERLPGGPLSTSLPVASGEGMALVEGFRGDILAWVRLDAQGKVLRCHLRDPSWFQWPLLEAAIEGNIVADFPLCNKSFNCSYSGHDL
ncbi:MAG TPA: nickel-dependent hydrogenase large subunit [Xanthomonadales bacterium]|nr:nickel-dependent hydrogenase large subunit [Xanthomonadales bacterium]